jgi:hypothetical protein
MDAVALLHRAQEAGLHIEPKGDRLLIRGPKRLEPVVKLLEEHKAEVLAVLGNTVLESGPLAPVPWFDRKARVAEGEPGLEMPCAARRGRTQEVEGAFLHFCVECGAFGAFGYGVSLRAGRLGRWYCAEHRPQKLMTSSHG